MEINRVKPCQYPLKIDEILKEALDCVNDFITFFQNSSKMLFLYESDIQADLLVRLKKRIPPLSFSKIEGKDLENVYQLGLITSEYPVGIKFDLVCINPYMVEDYVKWRTDNGKNSKLINHVFWEFPLLFAIELKFCFYGGKVNGEDVLKDFNKLSNYNSNYHTLRNKQLPQPGVNFTSDFRFLSLNFFHEQSFFNKTKTDLQNDFNMRKIKKVDEWNCIYLINSDEKLKFEQ